jgi:hypothetical protein
MSTASLSYTCFIPKPPNGTAEEDYLLLCKVLHHRLARSRPTATAIRRASRRGARPDQCRVSAQLRPKKYPNKTSAVAHTAPPR